MYARVDYLKSARDVWIEIEQIEKNRYEVNVKFLQNLTPEWQNITGSIQLSQNLGKMGLHDLYSMMVQHEEIVSRPIVKTKENRPSGTSCGAHGGSNFAPVPSFQDNYFPDEPAIRNDENCISEEELHNMNESLSLISHNMQRLNASKAFNKY
ncbi:hypothetical protein OSB04_011223 [Centaurea solstitialis]|uniref:Uncharacterized protein n=1 Tax=Centaurea solstitialis TaxID=347529 RepID=A0AA38WNW9_9ASTR|nr:hypothetical protein OSB04_011223 [Centaurea solstitialis]